MNCKKLGEDFFHRDALIVAQELAGKVLVRKFSDGTVKKVRISETEAYRGEEEQLRKVLDGRGDLLGVQDEESMRYNTMKIHVERDEDVRSVISAVNEAVELRSFDEIIPSMNDIFIRAVDGKL